MTEAQYQAKLIRKLKRMFPGCLVLVNDAGHIQGIPDLLILHLDKWAALEVKLESKSKIQPNQAYYVGIMRDMSFAAFINPETERDVLNELQYTLAPRRSARVS